MDELVVNESMANDDWIVTDIDMIKSCVVEELDDEFDYWIPRNLFKSFRKGKKKVENVEESKSRFYVQSPDYNDYN